ncbi:MAG: hydantoinase/oxoprolinase family protein, partial [Streptosporangiaceae bacterium]
RLLNALAQLRRRTGAVRGQTESITVGHTIALNALLQRRGARTALITTAGFRDVLELGRESRPLLFDLRQDGRPLLVPRHLRFEITERLDASGDVVRPLDLSGLDPIVESLRAEDVVSVAICLLHSYANPSHEIAVAELLRERCPDLDVCASHEVLSEHREFERSVLTVLNAYVMPSVTSFMDDLTRALAQDEPTALLAVTDSAGGAMAAAASRRRAIHSALSGPASGVRAASVIGAACGELDVLTLDIGGTSCDVGLVRGGQPTLTSRNRVAGFPLGLQSTDVQSVGAGGGSVAWVDAGGLLRVGPRSAGAVPGPACYGRGGTEPTVTDAHLILGHLDSGQPLAGELFLRIDLAEQAIIEQVAAPLGLTAEAAAAGIVAVADAELIRALEVISIERGYDPREAALVAFGGAGPLHCGAIAAELGIKRVIIPVGAGVLCALGALSAEERYDFSQTRVRSSGSDPRAWLNLISSELLDRARKAVPGLTSEFARDYLLEMRYVGQTSTIPILVDIEADDVLEQSHKEFEQAYNDVFGYSMPRPTEIESVRLVVHRTRNAAAFDSIEDNGSMPGRSWRAHFGQAGFQDCVLIEVDHLGIGDPIRGPAIITSDTSTAVIMPGQIVTRDSFGNV